MNSQRIILVAYQCGPGMGSVSQIGWEWYARLCAQQPVTLVTHVRNRAALDAAGAPLANSEILYIDTEWFAGPLYRVAKKVFPRSEHSVFLVSSLDYFVFDVVAYRTLKRYLAETAARDGDNRVLHRVTPVTMAAPTWLGHLGLPLVIGPLNSGLGDPQGFGTIMKQESTWLIRVRGLTRVLDALAGSTRNAARILTASRATLDFVSLRHRSSCSMMIENAVELSRFTATPWPAAPSTTNPLRVLFVGRLVPVKALDLLLRALVQARKRGVNVQLDVVGDGPMRNAWSELAIQLGLHHNVSFYGACPLDVVARHLQACHVLCLPSVRESGGSVLLEAMASARPVIGLNFGGPAEIVSDEVGALLPLESPQQVSTDIAATLEDIVNNPAAWAQRGRNGRTVVERRYTWPAKIEQAQSLYREVLNERGLAC